MGGTPMLRVSTFYISSAISASLLRVSRLRGCISSQRGLTRACRASAPPRGRRPSSCGGPWVDPAERLAAGRHSVFFASSGGSRSPWAAISSSHISTIRSERQRRRRQRVEHRGLVDVVAAAFQRGADEQLVLRDVRLHVADELRRQLADRRELAARRGRPASALRRSRRPAGSRSRRGWACCRTRRSACRSRSSG